MHVLPCTGPQALGNKGRPESASSVHFPPQTGSSRRSYFAMRRPWESPDPTGSTEAKVFRPDSSQEFVAGEVSSAELIPDGIAYRF